MTPVPTPETLEPTSAAPVVTPTQDTPNDGLANTGADEILPVLLASGLALTIGAVLVARRQQSESN